MDTGTCMLFGLLIYTILSIFTLISVLDKGRRVIIVTLTIVVSTIIIFAIYVLSVLAGII